MYSNEEEIGGGGMVLSRLKIPASIYKMSSCCSFEKDDELQKIIERHKASQIFLNKFNFHAPKKIEDNYSNSLVIVNSNYICMITTHYE